MTNWYWRDGTLALPLGMDFNDPLWLTRTREIEEKLCDMSYKVVKQEMLANGFFVSTVWLGLDHSFGNGPPLIFETMVFGPELRWSEDYSGYDKMRRYATEAEALEGHEEVKAEVEKHQRS